MRSDRCDCTPALFCAATPGKSRCASRAALSRWSFAYGLLHIKEQVKLLMAYMVTERNTRVPRPPYRVVDLVLTYPPAFTYNGTVSGFITLAPPSTTMFAPVT